MNFVKIPIERIGVLIGSNGEIKREIEKMAKIEINSDGEVAIDDSNPLIALKVRDVITAIGRGFSPKNAFKLFDDDAYFALIDIRDYVGKREKDVRRIAARIIGKNGKMRKTIEEATGANLSIYGHTIGIISDIDGMSVAKESVGMILNGCEHSTVYRFLERKKRERRLKELTSKSRG